MAIKAVFTPGPRVLASFGDGLDNEIEISRNAAGEILVNGGAIPVLGGTPSVGNTGLLQLFGQDGDDVLTLNEANGALPRANILAGAGEDTVTGGSGNDLVFGQNGDDALAGKGGADQLFGGAGNDTLTGGDGDDQLFGNGGNDRLVWNPGDDSDVFEGGLGIDTAEVNGGNGAEVFTMTANGTRVRFDRLDPAPFAIDIGTTERAEIAMGGGDDRFSATGNLAALISVAVDGGAGNDTILGSNGADELRGGDGDDVVDGQQGNDLAWLGAGDDVFQWDPGDGNDVVDGGDGTDRLLFNGSNANEIMTIAANGDRVLFTRNIANITMDLDGLEVIEVNALGGADAITLDPLAGTDTKAVRVNLAGTLGGSTGDAAADTVSLQAGGGADSIQISGSGGAAKVSGITPELDITGAEAIDTLRVDGLDGDDLISAEGLATVMRLELTGGAGSDTLVGGLGNDLLNGGDGDDVVVGRQGNDVALLGTGDDTFTWDPGEGSDLVEGGAGTDRLVFTGSNASESMAVVANGTRALVTRDVGAITMDLAGVELVQVEASGGADAVTVGDLTGTDVTRVDIGLGAGDGAVDGVTANGTQGADTILLTSKAGTVLLDGLKAVIAVHDVEATDALTVNGQGGSDVIDATGLAAGVVGLTVTGGLGDDTILGSAGAETVLGGDGSDLAQLGGGDDRFLWNPGDDNDVVDGGSGIDTLDFNGANVAEVMTVSASGAHATVTRNIANVVMDLRAVEVLDIDALGGTDSITVNDLSGTDVSLVRVNLAANGGGGDAAADTIVINATGADDVIQLVNNNGVVRVTGLAATVEITGFEAADRIVINGLGGDDVIEASGFGGMLLTGDGGAGDDALLGSLQADTLLGGEGDDILLGGGGADLLDGGTGDNIVIPSTLMLSAGLVFA